MTIGCILFTYGGLLQVEASQAKIMALEYIHANQILQKS